MTVAVVGLGKIGLPLAVQFATKGHRVIGADINEAVVDSVTRGEAPFDEEAGLGELLADVVREGLFEATTDTTVAASRSDVIIIVVPLVVDDGRAPVFRSLDAATRAVAAGLRAGTLVSIETTMPVGTTRERLTPILEAGSDLRVGVSLQVCHSPERVFSGRVFADLRRYPKLVGGVDRESGARAVEFYGSALDFDERPDLHRPNGVWDLGSAETAEFAKLAETTYRNVNIAFANELATIADGLGVDVGAAIEGSNSQPFSHIHSPGIAVGGHCIPVYPHLLRSSGVAAPVVDAAIAVNERMPMYAVERVSEALGELSGRRVAVLGASYRGGVKELAFSGVYPTVAALSDAGAHPTVHDPMYSAAELTRERLEPYELGTPVDAAILQADHASYRELRPEDLPGVKVVLDGRRVLDPAHWEGVTLLRIGDGGRASRPSVTSNETSR